jgi:hypothetical protein
MYLFDFKEYFHSLLADKLRLRIFKSANKTVKMSWQDTQIVLHLLRQPPILFRSRGNRGPCPLAASGFTHSRRKHVELEYGSPNKN